MILFPSVLSTLSEYSSMSASIEIFLAFSSVMMKEKGVIQPGVEAHNVWNECNVLQLSFLLQKQTQQSPLCSLFLWQRIQLILHQMQVDIDGQISWKFHQQFSLVALHCFFYVFPCIDFCWCKLCETGLWEQFHISPNPVMSQTFLCRCCRFEAPSNESDRVFELWTVTSLQHCWDAGFAKRTSNSSLSVI